MAAVILLLGFFLAATGGRLVQRWHSASARQQSLSFEDQLGIVANTAGLIVITWWSMSLAIAFAAALLERRGRTRAAAATAKFSPAFMRRLALAAVGLQLITAPLATAATPPAGPDAGQSSPAAVSAMWSPTADTTHPGPPDSAGTPDSAAATAPASPAPARAPAPDPVRSSDGPGLDPQWKPLSPVVEAGPLTARQLRTQDPPTAPAEVTVRAGDSLWSLAAAALGPFASDVDIAKEWPRLYQTNRAVIGDNPHLLRPGQVLLLPPAT
ncbi:LysM peptidoglycan-binding domain-containing protein [Pseudarthrobacter sp. S9]|uniref:LysM peptidoglycan-binding domain-containing protein n=1 Tax=Pseudarthrobacter sp. S9 TaxID=3418421 RepID=UPI003D0790E0